MGNRGRIVFSRKYEPLFLPQKTRYTVVTGGRGSGKSFAVNTSLCNDTYNDRYHTLFTRYTMTSAEISIIPEFMEKLDLLGIGDDFRTRSASITNLATGAQIIFRGLLASSGNQVAKLKSIQGVRRWIFDEAQELDDPEMFDTVDFSLRQKDADNNITIVLNPPDIHHWVYERFFAPHGIPDGFNGVVDGVLYIHTTYLDNLDNLDRSFIEQAEKMRTADPKRYANVFLGHWSTLSEGIVYHGWQQIRSEDFPHDLPCWYGVDWGYENDPSAVVCMCYDPDDKCIYIREVCYRDHLLPRHIGAIIAQDMKGNGIGRDAMIYCDPARPEHIAELRLDFDLNAVRAVNRDKEGRVVYLKYFGVRYVGDNIRHEVERYSYEKDRKDPSRYTNTPMDGNDHAMDAISYAAVTHLRWLGVTNRAGEE